MGALEIDLLSPEAHGAPLPRRVDRVETHISWVFLTEKEALKVKKSVAFGFLDFSTVERRRQACEEEVRLNRRLAPSVYLGVVPVRLHEGRHHLGPEGDIVDWAVRMVRLPESDRADARLRRGVLTPEHVDALARRLAVFHGACPADAATAALGSVAAIERNVRENFEETRGAIAEFADPAEAHALEAWQLSFLREHAADFARRVEGGRVREGHGDLRLDAVYFDDDGAVTVIDCIEFSDRFRVGDVCADVAFFAMDLSAHDAVVLAERFLATYAREAGDFDLYPLVDFYESYRAYVRAKIAMIVSADDGATEASRAHARREARRHVLLSLAETRRPVAPPVVVAVGGIIASGKSTVADRLGHALSAPVVDADRTRKEMLGLRPDDHVHESAWHGAYDPAFTARVYEEVARRAGAVLSSGRPVLLDASFRSATFRRRAKELAQSHGVPFVFVECRAPRDVCRARLALRKDSVSDADVAIFDDFCDRFEAVVELPPEEHVVLDTEGGIGAGLPALLARLAAPGDGRG